MSGITTVLNTGRGALFAAQSQLSVTGNNIANVNTEGYRRQEVRLEEGLAIDGKPGQIGTGVVAKEVIRHFNTFIEAQYNDKASNREKWEKLHDSLSAVEMMVNESDENGLGKALEQFWEDWQDLTARPDDDNTRSALLGHAQNLITTLSSMSTEMENLRVQMDDFIQQEVNEVNDLLKDIAELNLQITIHEDKGKNNPNALLDERDKKVRLLAEKLDVKTINNGAGDFTIITRAGHTLVDGPESFSISFGQGGSQEYLTKTSTFTGEIAFSGESGHELLVEVVGGGDSQGTATYKISLDGGASWLTEEDGTTKIFTANNHENRAAVLDGDVEIWFTAGADNTLSVGDRFEILPKKVLYWHETTSSKVNITPRNLPNGQEDLRRLTGGSLAGLFQFKDIYAGKYQEKLDEFARGLAWEVNRLHSQGAGKQGFFSVEGTYAVTNSTQNLFSPNSGLLFGDHLQSGNLNIFVYDANGNLVSTNPKIGFGGGGAQGNFDPKTMSPEDVRDAINARADLTAEIIGGKLSISTATVGNTLVFGADTTGLLAALGVNTFFEGGDAGDMALNPKILSNLGHINAGHVNGAGEFNPGDNYTAKEIAKLQHKEVVLHTEDEGTTSQTLQEYYNSLVSNIGGDANMVKYNLQYESTLANDLNSRQEEISGVNLDEEMSNLIRFQHSYTAAAKLITTADQMLNVLLGIKQ